MDSDPPTVTIQQGDDYQQVAPDTARRVLTTARLRVLAYVSDESPESVSAIATALERSYANVHADIEALSEAGLLCINTDGRTNQPQSTTPTTTPRLVFDEGSTQDDTAALALPDSATAGTTAEWLPRQRSLKDPTELERGDVAWLPDQDGGLALLVLSHDLPAGCAWTSGIALVLSPDAHDEQHIPIQPTEWVDGGPGVETAAIPWAVQSFDEDQAAGVVGTVDNDRCNDISIAVQRYTGPVRR